MSVIYTDEFKEQIVSLRLSGRKTKDLCRDYGLGKNTVTDWFKRYSVSGKFSKADSLTADQKLILELKKEIKHLSLENDVLKKVTQVLGIKRKG